jgi:lysophospholipid acyltransferase (LPLAT)-like uncharacterized protein
LGALASGWQIPADRFIRSSVLRVGKSIRRLRFAVLEKIVLPLAIVPLRALVWSWRRRGPDPTLIAQVAKAPRVIFAIWHGTFFSGLAFTRLWLPYGRRWVALTTPSLDGDLARAVLDRFGVGHASLARDVRGVDAARQFITRVEAGEIGVLLVDGPRGPRAAVKPGVARTIAAARAQVVVAGIAAAPSVRLRSWDRFCVPTPFAHVLACCALLPPLAAGDAGDLAVIQAALEGAAAEAEQGVTGQGPLLIATRAEPTAAAAARPAPPPEHP